MPIYRIRDWDVHFEQDRSKRYKHLKWVPVPNKLDGAGYTLIMELDNGPAVFGAWVAIVELASKCNPRGTLQSASKAYTVSDISRMTRIPVALLSKTIEFCSNSLDWIIVGHDLDKNVQVLDKNVSRTPVDSSILFSSIQSSSVLEGGAGETAKPFQSSHATFLAAGPVEWTAWDYLSGQAWARLHKDQPNVSAEALIASAVAYREYCIKSETCGQFVKQPQNWLADGAWSVDWAKQAERSSKGPNKKQSLSDQMKEFYANKGQK